MSNGFSCSVVVVVFPLLCNTVSMVDDILQTHHSMVKLSWFGAIWDPFPPHIFNHIISNPPSIHMCSLKGARDAVKKPGRKKKRNTLMAKIILSVIRSRTCLSTHNLGLSGFVFPDLPEKLTSCQNGQ